MRYQWKEDDETSPMTPCTRRSDVSVILYILFCIVVLFCIFFIHVNFLLYIDFFCSNVLFVYIGACSFQFFIYLLHCINLRILFMFIPCPISNVVSLQCCK
jgi:hypothetical protein